jgi:FkbM family methyltransferase
MRLIPRRLTTGRAQRQLVIWREKAYRLKALSPLISGVTCVDVGASHFPHNKWWLFLQSPSVHWLAVDADSSTLEYIDWWPWPCSVEKVAVALGSSDEIRNLSITNVASGSSLLPLHDALGDAYRVTEPERSYFLPVSNRDVKTQGILEFLNQQPTDRRFLLKLDTQGTEFELIRACKPMISEHRVVAIETEISLLHTPPYRGAPRLWDEVQKMETDGFELLLLDIHSKQATNRARSSRTIVSEADAVFVIRRDLALESDLSLRLQLLAVYFTYRLIDEALLLLRDDKELAATLRGVVDIP